MAGIAPHGGIVIEELCAPDQLQLAAKTRAAMEELRRRFAAASPQVVVVMTPHSVHVGQSFAVVTSAKVAGEVDEEGRKVSLECRVDRELAVGVLSALNEVGVPTLPVSFGGNDPDAAVFPLDWGALIPLWFLGGRFNPPLPVVIVSPCRELQPADHVRAGSAIARACEESGKQVALVASADHGHAHREDGPYGFDPAAKEYDDMVVDAIKRNALGDLEFVDPGLVERAKADSWWQLLMLHGALGSGWSSQLLSYECPTYFGMVVAVVWA